MAETPTCVGSRELWFRTLWLSQEIFTHLVQPAGTFFPRVRTESMSTAENILQKLFSKAVSTWASQSFIWSYYPETIQESQSPGVDAWSSWEKGNSIHSTSIELNSTVHCSLSSPSSFIAHTSAIHLPGPQYLLHFWGHIHLEGIRPWCSRLNRKTFYL